MDIDRFITLQTVVEEGSFARAANKLCCTQSTVTYHIKELEQELSVQLFEKIGRRMLLTDAGRTVLPLSREPTQAVEHIRRALRPGELGGELRLAMGETLLAYHMPGVLSRFKSLAPHVRVSLRSLNCDVILDMLLSGGADMGIFYSTGDVPSLIMETLGTFPLTLAASPRLPGSDGEPDFTRPNQRLPVSLVINEAQCVYRLMAEHTLRQRNIVLDTAIELWSIESIKRCVEGGLGVTYLPKFCMEKELREGTLRELPFHSEPETVTAVCAYHANKCLSPAAKLFLSLLQEGL